MQQYPKNSGTYNRLLSEQRSTVCNRAEKGVCCENSRVHNSDRNQKFGLKEKSFEHENCGQFSESPSQVSFKISKVFNITFISQNVHVTIKVYTHG